MLGSLGDPQETSHGSRVPAGSASIVNTPGHTKCIVLNNQQGMIQHILINLHPYEYTHGLGYYSSAVKVYI